jgi:hypothetical protein
MESGEVILTNYTKKSIVEYVIKEENKLIELLEKNFKGDTSPQLMKAWSDLRNARDYLGKYHKQIK